MVKINKSLMERALQEKKSDKVFMIVLMAIVAVMLVAIILHTFVFFNIQVKGPSMEPTMYTDDVLIANRYKKVTYGSIVIIEGEKANGDWLIKRVVAMEGDTVKIEDGYVHVKYKNKSDFTVLSESYVKEKGVTQAHDWQEKTLGEGEIFYLGDNRLHSSDSRDENFSTCDRSQIIGVIEDWSFTFKSVTKKLQNLFG